jgi:CHASE3 domain sensor protein
MGTSTRLILAAAIVGGVCGIAGAAFYVRWRATSRSLTERTSAVLRQLTDVADRMEQALTGSSGFAQTPTAAD